MARHHTQLGFVCVLFGTVGCDLTAKEQLGARLFDDANLSAGHNQSCASCHGRDVGGTGPDSAVNEHGAVYEGSVASRFGNRKPPSSAYATRAPRFSYSVDLGFVGGVFWDGRGTGWKLGTPAADQSQGPFLNPVEQAVPDSAELVSRVCSSEYGRSFKRTWGESACEDVDLGYADIGLSIAEFEDSRVVNSFSSKYDAAVAGMAELSAKERQGLELFQGQGKCSTCHAIDSAGGHALFTDFTFDNLGVPPNPENPFYEMDQVLVDGKPVNPAGSTWIDPGLAGFLDQLVKDPGWRSLPYVSASVSALSPEAISAFVAPNYGKHRVPTLRNVDLRPTPGFVKAYGHNGFFKSLEGIVHFYNTRDVLEPCAGRVTEAAALANNCWPAAEVAENVNHDELGDLGLSDAEEDALVAFLGTLSDGWH